MVKLVGWCLLKTHKLWRVLLCKSRAIQKKQGGALKLVGVTKKLKDLLVITKLATVFDSFDTEAAALESYGA